LTSDGGERLRRVANLVRKLRVEDVAVLSRPGDYPQEVQGSTANHNGVKTQPSFCKKGIECLQGFSWFHRYQYNRYQPGGNVNYAGSGVENVNGAVAATPLIACLDRVLAPMPAPMPEPRVAMPEPAMPEPRVVSTGMSGMPEPGMPEYPLGCHLQPAAAAGR
jgi:hypothetical protein